MPNDLRISYWACSTLLNFLSVNIRNDFLGFEFRWGVDRWRKPTLKRRTSRDKLRALLATFKVWFIRFSGLPKKILFAKLNRKRLGYYNFYGIRGNSKSLSSFAYRVGQLFYKWLNRRSQRKSYTESSRVVKQCEASRLEEPGAVILHAGICEGALG